MENVNMYLGIFASIVGIGSGAWSFINGRSIKKIKSSVKNLKGDGSVGAFNQQSESISTNITNNYGASSELLLGITNMVSSNQYQLNNFAQSTIDVLKSEHNLVLSIKKLSDLNTQQINFIMDLLGYHFKSEQLPDSFYEKYNLTKPETTS